jgi:hypothetical protein
VTVCVRPESWRLGERSGETTIGATLAETIFLGEMAQHTLELPGGSRVRANVINPGLEPLAAQGSSVQVSASPDDVIVLG